MVLLYYLSQKPDFADSVKPLMSQIKDSEEMLRFLNDLSKFTQTFSTFSDKGDEKNEQKAPPKSPNAPHTPPNAPCDDKKKENPQSPTAGIADAFIQNILDSYLKKN